jgi:hypothetical protein
VHFDTHILAILDIIACFTRFVSGEIFAAYEKRIASISMASLCGQGKL